jgi:hypothetical protein
MFRRIVLEDWQRSLSLIGWGLFALVFVTSILRAFRLPKDQVAQLKGLPLEEDSHSLKGDSHE